MKKYIEEYFTKLERERKKESNSCIAFAYSKRENKLRVNF